MKSRLTQAVLLALAASLAAGCATQQPEVPVSIAEAPTPKRDRLAPVTLSAAQVQLVRAGLKERLKDLVNVDGLKAGQQAKSGAVTVCGHAIGKSGKMPFTGNFLDVKSKADPKRVTTTFVPLSIGASEAERYSVTKVCLEDGLGI